MKKLLLAVTTTISFVSTNGQTYVTIPDTNFVSHLQLIYPFAMSGNQMDITNPSIMSETILSISGLGIYDITGVEYFDNLEVLNCDNNLLTSLPPLPNKLLLLECQSNQLTNLPTLPDSLVNLSCSFNNLTTIPTLPANIIQITCFGNSLTNLPVLPNAIKWISCGANNITSLPSLPDSLLYLECSQSLLTTLPELPSGLTNLNCIMNNISCFPAFPLSLTQIYIFANPFSCLPNYISAMDSGTLSYPLCLIGDSLNNPTHCNSAGGIIGSIFSDIDANCMLNFSDLRINNIPMKLYDSADSLIVSTSSLSNGIFNLAIPYGNYKISVDTTALPFDMQCLNSMDSSFTLSSSVPLISNVNFPIECTPGFDIGVQSVATLGTIFPGLQHHLKVNAGDLSHWYGLNCAAGTGGTVKIIFSGPVNFDAIEPGSLTPTITGTTLSYSISDFGLINNLQDFNIILKTDTSAIDGDNICIDVTTTTSTSDNDTANNFFHFCYQVVNSHDPNKKEVFPTIVEPLYNDWLTYTIHFQNVGTAQAYNIRITDLIESNLDVETIQIMSYSHANYHTLVNNLLTFNFPNINLVDSASDEIASRGFVQFRIKPMTNLPLGTLIENTASIYFDYNSSINTNIASTIFTSTSSIVDFNNENNLSVYPNPTSENITINFTSTSKNSSIKIYDATGRLVKNLENVKSGENTINISELENGLYLLNLQDGNNSLTKRFIKQ